MLNESSSIHMTIDHHISHEDEIHYYLEVPFNMPERAEVLHVKIHISSLGKGDLTVDLGLKGPSRVIGWSGGARKEFYVGVEKATPGYLPSELTPGPWAILLGAYRIPKMGCDVKIHLHFQLEEGRWLSGDLHSHTVHSDGSYTLAEAAEIMEELGCDFIATTDHNTVSQNYVHPKESSVVFIPGMELTTNQGHANFLGVIDPIEDFRTSRLEDIHEHVRTAKKKGAKVVLNHPHCDACPWEWGFAVDYDWVEVWNGPWMDRNRRALDWWHKELTKGRRLVAIGGSDTHKPHPYVKHAMPTTWVFALTRTVAGILEGIARGHVCISYSAKGPTIECHIGSSMIGDVVNINRDHAIKAVMTLKRLNKGDTIKIISNQGIEKEIIVTKDEKLTYAWSVLDRMFYRIEVWRHFSEVDGLLIAALSNPIYIK